MKPKPNGHDTTEAVPVETRGAIRKRRYKERRARGAVVLKAVVIEPDFIAALAANGWLHESETRDAGAVEHALLALIMRALGSGMTPNPARATLEIDVDAVHAALPWLKPGTPVTSQSAGKALGIVARCSATVGFTPQEFANRLRQMIEGRTV